MTPKPGEGGDASPKATPKRRRRERPVIGWREWAALPGIGLSAIRVKVDTGARSSSLHATRLSTFERDGQIWVRFRVGSRAGKWAAGRWCEALSRGMRKIRSSTGELQRRHVIVTELALGGETWQIEISLADRREMGFEMLVGRTAVRRRFLVDPGRSYLTGSREREPAMGMQPKPIGEEE